MKLGEDENFLQWAEKRMLSVKKVSTLDRVIVSNHPSFKKQMRDWWAGKKERTTQ